MRGHVVTIIGASGFVGRHVVAILARAGFVVRAVARHPGRAQFLRSFGEVGQVAVLQGEVGNAKSMARAISGADSVVYLPGILADRGRQTFAGVHRDGPGLVARIAKESGCRALVHVSAIGAGPQSASRYGQSKADGENAVRRHFAQATILRPSIIFGAEDQFFTRFAAMALVSFGLPLIGGGHTRFQPVFVGDVAQSIYHALRDTKHAGELYELGGPGIYTFRELLTFTLSAIQRNRALVPIPFAVASVIARIAGLLPNPVLTVDQLAMLRQDNIVAQGAKGMAELDIQPTAVEVVTPLYLERFRPGGRWARQATGNGVLPLR